jgi:hypothetical protein
MKIPVFVSCPTSISNQQLVSKKVIFRELDKYGLEPRNLGTSDYPTDCPLREVYILARKCSGGIILGFEQFRANKGFWVGQNKKPLKVPRGFPTAWNHLEAGILFSLQIPLIVFKEETIEGGIFDHGVTDVFIHKMPSVSMSKEERNSLSAVFLKWQTDVREHYYK